MDHLSRTRQGWHLISPDGKTIRDLGKFDASYLAFSLDGKKLYGIRKEKEHQYLFSLDVNGSKRHNEDDRGYRQRLCSRVQPNPGLPSERRPGWHLRHLFHRQHQIQHLVV